MGLLYTKWNKYKVMRGSEELQKYLPKTFRFNKANLRKATEKFSECILKPNGLSGGDGVMLIRKQNANKFKIQADQATHVIDDFEKLYAWLSEKIKRSYIIQQRIDLANIDDRLFDLRVMVQRHTGRASKWNVTGMLVKVGGKGFIITNTKRSSGYVLPLETALRRSSIDTGNMNGIQQELDRIALHLVHNLQLSFEDIQSVGIDFGLDSKGRIWIIEANFIPSRALFKKLKDKTMYRRIMTY